MGTSRELPFGEKQREKLGFILLLLLLDPAKAWSKRDLFHALRKAFEYKSGSRRIVNRYTDFLVRERLAYDEGSNVRLAKRTQRFYRVVFSLFKDVRITNVSAFKRRFRKQYLARELLIDSHSMICWINAVDKGFRKAIPRRMLWKHFTAGKALVWDDLTGLSFVNESDIPRLRILLSLLQDQDSILKRKEIAKELPEEYKDLRLNIEHLAGAMKDAPEVFRRFRRQAPNYVRGRKTAKKHPRKGGALSV